MSTFFFLFLHINYIVGTHAKCLTQAFLMSSHNACFHQGVDELDMILSDTFIGNRYLSVDKLQSR